MSDQSLKNNNETNLIVCDLSGELYKIKTIIKDFGSSDYTDKYYSMLNQGTLLKDSIFFQLYERKTSYDECNEAPYEFLVACGEYSVGLIVANDLVSICKFISSFDYEWEK